MQELLSRLDRFREFLANRKKDVLKYGAAAILLVVPLYPKFPVFNVPGTYVAIRMEDFLIALLGIYWFLLIFLQNPHSFFKSKLNQAILLFWAVGLLSVISGIFLTQSVSPALGLIHWLRRVEYLVPFFIALAAVKEGSGRKFFIEILLIASFVIFVYGAGQIYLNWPVISTQNEEYAKGLALRWIPGARVHSTFAGHYDLAAFFVLVLPIAVAYLFTIKILLKRAIVFFLYIAPAFWLFLQTESRISFVSYLVGISVTLFVIKKKLFILPVLAISILAMFFLSDLGARYRRTIDFYLEKTGAVIELAQPKEVFADNGEGNDKRSLTILGATIVDDRSFSIRLNVEWPRALKAFYKNPLLGTGYSSITLATDNDYLRLLGEVGIVGALAFFLVLVRLLGKLGVFLRKNATLDTPTAFVGGFLGSLVGFLLNATFIDVFEASKVAIVFWTLAGVAVGTVRREL